MLYLKFFFIISWGELLNNNPKEYEVNDFNKLRYEKVLHFIDCPVNGKQCNGTMDLAESHPPGEYPSIRLLHG